MIDPSPPVTVVADAVGAADVEAVPVAAPVVEPPLVLELDPEVDSPLGLMTKR